MIRQHRPARALTPSGDGFHYFFGYYDKCPWSADGGTMLAHRVRFLERMPEQEDTAEIGVLRLRPDGPGEFAPLSLSRAWNWQQGAQLQWTGGGEGGPERVLFNDRRSARGIAVLMDSDGRSESILEHPVYTVSRDGRAALTLDYGRLTHLRPEYGWAGEPDAWQDDPAPDETGVFRMDMATGRRDLLVSIRELAHHKPSPHAILPGRVLAHQHVNHLMFNPSGTRFCFLHRFQRADGILHSRLFTLGIDGSDLRLVFEGMVSHYHWKDDATILAWAGRRALLDTGAGASGGAKAAVMSAARRTLKPVYYALGKPRILMNRVLKDSYLLISDMEGAAGGGGSRAFAAGELTCDGHCTYSPDGNYVLTDGYPDMKSRQPLFVWDVRENVGYEIGRYRTPKRLDGPLRVDLHPRWSRDGGRVCIDSAMDGTRRVYEVEWRGAGGAN